MCWQNILVYIGIVSAWISIAIFISSVELSKQLREAKDKGKLDIKVSTSNWITYIALFLFIATFLAVVGKFIFTGDTRLDANLTVLAVTAALGLFAVFSLMSERYFKNMEQLKDYIKQIAEDNDKRQKELEKSKEEIMNIKNNIEDQYNKIKDICDLMFMSIDLNEKRNEQLMRYISLLAESSFKKHDYIFAGILYNNAGNLHNRIRKLVCKVIGQLDGYELTLEQRTNLIRSIKYYDGDDKKLSEIDQEIYDKIVNLEDEQSDEVVGIIISQYPTKKNVSK